MRQFIYGVVAILGTVGTCAIAHAAAFEPDVTVLADEVIYDINADGTFTREETRHFRLETDRAVKANSQVAMRYSTSLQDLAVEDAYTTTKDGKRIDVAADKIIVQQSRESAGAPMFDDGKVKTVIFPATEIGATLTLKTRYTQRQALFPGQFSAIEYFGVDKPYQSVRLVVRAPATLKLNVDAIDMQGGLQTSTNPDTQQWQWTLANTPAHAPEPGSVALVDHSPRVAITTFPDFASVAAAYNERALPKAAVTPAIQTLADSLTQGVTDRRKQAQILYEWVTKNVRYVGVYLAFGGVVPHEASAILDAKYGDCKDHVTLLESLLAAKGIKSSPVLVNAGTGYWLPKVAAPLGVFNHAITYLPEFNLFVDSTASVARFGTLPVTEAGKLALVADDGTGRAKMVTLPANTPENARIDITTRVVLDDDGNLKGTGEIATSGMFDWVSRQIFASVPAGTTSTLASQMLSAGGRSGQGDFTHGDPLDFAKPFAYQTSFEQPGYVQLPGPGAMQVPRGLSGFVNITSTFTAMSVESRDFAMPLAGRQVTETTIITLPKQVKLANLPKPVSIDSPLGSYRSSYKANGRVLTVTRTLRLTPTGMTIAPEQYPAFRKLGLAVLRDINAQLVY